MNNYNNDNLGQSFNGVNDNFQANNNNYNEYQNAQMNYKMGNQNQYDYMNPHENMQIQNQEFDMATVSEYKQRLRGMKEVQALTGEVEIQNPNSIVMFGQKASENISKVSD